MYSNSRNDELGNRRSTDSRNFLSSNMVCTVPCHHFDRLFINRLTSWPPPPCRTVIAHGLSLMHSLNTPLFIIRILLNNPILLSIRLSRSRFEYFLRPLNNYFEANGPIAIWARSFLIDRLIELYKGSWTHSMTMYSLLLSSPRV